MNYVEGVITRITYYNEDDHYGVIKIDVESSDITTGLFGEALKGILTVTGHFPRPAKNEIVRFYGEMTVHPTYGEQFSAKRFERAGTTNREGVIEYLSSDFFKGVGEKTAERVVDALGVEAIERIVADGSVLDDVTGMSAKVKKTLKEGLQKHKAVEHTLVRLYGHGISAKMAMRIIRVYGDETVSLVEDNPYRMIEDVDGIGFERADAIAGKLGIAENDPRRIRAFIVHLFKSDALGEGHTYVSYDTFIEKVRCSLESDDVALETETLEDHVERLVRVGLFVREDDRLSLKSVVVAEQEIAAKLTRLHETPQAVDETRVRRLITAFESAEGIRYTAKQKQAVIDALKHRVLIVTGGPGTGKTTVIKGLVDVYHRYHDLERPTDDAFSLIHLVAPTGRAAKRMKEATGFHATTIHRFLGYGFDGSFQHDKAHPVEGNLFIVDEASMIDIHLAGQLLQSLPDYANVVLVGDDAQLPSVGPGQVFKDLIEAGRLPVVELDYIHRQAQDSNIVALANAIRQGRLPSRLDEHHDDCYVVAETPDNFQPRLKRMIDYFIERGYDLLNDIQVLVPMYKGPLGIDETNRFLQETYNTRNDKTRIHGNRTFKLNDKILQLANQVEDGVMNGDQGRVVAIDEDGVVVEFLDARVTYGQKDLVNITHAYAMSVHKAQGSEYPVVILPVFSAYSIMLRRKLLYTGMTRAKEKLVIFGQTHRLKYAIERLEEGRRTTLRERLEGLQPSSRNDRSEEADLEKGPSTVVIDDEEIPFKTLGEDTRGKTPYDFLDEE